METTLTAQEKLVALVATSRKFEGFVIASGLQREINIALSLKGARKAEGMNRAVAAEARLRGVLENFFKGSSKYFGGMLRALRREGVREEFAAKVARSLRNYTVAVTRPIIDFEFAAGQYRAMSSGFAWAMDAEAVSRSNKEKIERKAAHERRLAALQAERDSLAPAFQELVARDSTTAAALAAVIAS
jgi:hypothetical protein